MTGEVDHFGSRTFHVKGDDAPVSASDEGVLSSIAPEGLGDGEAVQFPDGSIAEPLLLWDVDLHSVPQPAAIHIILVHLELKGCSLLLHNLHRKDEWQRWVPESTNTTADAAGC